MIIKDFNRRLLLKHRLKLKKAFNCNSDWYGNNYGGFFMNPDLLSKESIIYSFGIGEDISFDRSAITRHHCKVFGFDFTPRSIEWVSKQELPATFEFHAYGIGITSGLITLYLPKNEKHVSGSIVDNTVVDPQNQIQVPIKSLSDITSDLGHTSIDVLKMDIEGAEYEVLPSILKSKIRIGQILIEFHHKLCRNGISKTKEMVSLLKDKGLELFAISPSYSELSFINKEI